MSLAERLAGYSLSISYKQLDEQVRLEAKKRLIDSLGCAIGAFNESPVKVARRMVERSHPGRAATIIGKRLKTTPDMAAFVNGIMIRYFDYNDTYLSKEPAHPSDNISACMAVGEEMQSGGRDLLVAMSVAYEVQCRLCDAANIRHRGWDHVCYGLVSSALASGKLMGLSEKKLTHAVNIALNGHIAMRQVRTGELSEWKGCSFPNAARNAVFSATLAGHGMTGPAPIFEGEMGFFKQVSGEFVLDVDDFGGRKGNFKLPGTYIKFFPAEYHAQSAIWAALAVRKKLKSPNEIRTVEIQTHEAGYTILSKDKEKWAPTTKETADHSLPYMVGMTLLKGKVDNGTYSAKNISDEKVLSFLKKIKVEEDKDLTSMYPRHIANRVTVKLEDGTTISEQVDDPKGHPNNPVTKEEVEHKFRVLTSKFIGESQAKEIVEHVWSVEKRSVSSLLDLCALR
jgi:2-methylcitrate dehydratase